MSRAKPGGQYSQRVMVAAEKSTNHIVGIVLSAGQLAEPAVGISELLLVQHEKTPDTLFARKARQI